MVTGDPTVSAERDVHGEPAPPLSAPASRVVDELRKHGVTDQVGAINEIAAQEAAGLTSGEIAAVLWQFADPDELAPEQHLLIPEQDPEEDWDPQRCNDWEPAG